MDLYVEKIQLLLRSALQSVSPSYMAGFISGISNAGLFNWYDKALYESMKARRPFLHIDNFKKPWQGFQAAILGRVLSYGMFFPIADSFETFFKQYFAPHPELSRFLSSQATGMAICLPLAPISAVKYRMWGSHRGYIETSYKMFHHGGIKPFFQGIAPTLWRDCCWASAFVFAKHHGLELVKKINFNEIGYQDIQSQQGGEKVDVGVLNLTVSRDFLKSSCEFAAVTTAGMIATIASSPFNYVRNLVYSSHPLKKVPHSWKAITLLVKESRKQTSMSTVSFLQQRLNVGWGTARVAIGMAVSHNIYQYAKSSIETFQKNEK